MGNCLGKSRPSTELECSFSWLIACLERVESGRSMQETNRLNAKNVAMPGLVGADVAQEISWLTTGCEATTRGSRGSTSRQGISPNTACTATKFSRRLHSAARPISSTNKEGEDLTVYLSCNAIGKNQVLRPPIVHGELVVRIGAPQTKGSQGIWIAQQFSQHPDRRRTVTSYPN